jgi:transposase
MWKPEHRIAAAARRGLRYPSDMSDAEWALVEPMIPPGRRGGRPRGVNLCEVLNAIFYVLATGCQWQALPKDLPPKSTAHHYFALWDWDGTLERIHDALYVATREAAGRKTSPTAAVSPDLRRGFESLFDGARRNFSRFAAHGVLFACLTNLELTYETR